MSLFKWVFDYNCYVCLDAPCVDASVMLQRPLRNGRRVDEWLLRMSIFIEQTGDFESFRNSYNTREKAMQAAEETIVRAKLEGKI